MTVPVQVALTDDLALKARLAIDSILADENYEFEDEERADFERLAVFLGQVATNPGQFRPQGKLAKSVRRVTRRVAGQAQPQSRRNKRKSRQERRQGFAKRRRAERREMAARFNAAREVYEAERQEMDEIAAEQAARFERQAKYRIVSPTGDVFMDDIPAELIQTADGEPAFKQLLVIGGDS